MQIERKKIICLVCCRGGSKTIKDKNIKKFSGKPLLYWTINNAKKAKIFDQIIVSTDSKKILDLAETYGAFCPGLRPKKISLDNSDQFDTHKYIFNKLNLNDENSVICVLNNNPFLDYKLLRKSFTLFKRYKFNKIVTDVIKIGGDYLFFKQFEIKKSSLNYVNKTTFLNSKINRQSLKEYYVNIFNIRWAKPKILSDYNIFKKKLLAKDNHAPIMLSKLQNFDIDDYEDWKIAETIFSNYTAMNLNYNN